MSIEQWDGEPCHQCGSPRHSTTGHAKLENVYRRWGPGLTNLAIQMELPLDGVAGPPSPSERLSATNGEKSYAEGGTVPPDRVRIVPFTISGSGTERVFEAQGILRLWSEDPEGGFTFMLSWDPSPELPTKSLARLFGTPGIPDTVVIELTPSFRTVEQPGT